MFDLLLQWLHYQHTFYEESDLACPECDECYLTLDIIDAVYRYESTFTLTDDVS